MISPDHRPRYSPGMFICIPDESYYQHSQTLSKDAAEKKVHFFPFFFLLLQPSPSTCLCCEGVMAQGNFLDPLVASLETVDLRRLSESFSFQMDSMVPFFCGDSEVCRTLGSQTALRRAKANIREKVSVLNNLILNIELIFIMWV